MNWERSRCAVVRATTRESPTGEHWSPLLAERPQRLSHVRGTGADRLVAVLYLDGGLQRRCIDIELQDLLGEPDAGRTIRVDHIGEVERHMQQLFAVDYAVDEADIGGLFGVDEASGQQDLVREPEADDARQHPRATAVA